MPFDFFKMKNKLLVPSKVPEKMSCRVTQTMRETSLIRSYGRYEFDLII